MILNHIGVSGGKDSDALLLWAVHESGYAPESLRVSFCNTGNEHELTLAHVRMLGEKVHPIVWLEPDRDFYELAEWKQRFPSAKARFCTEFLKMIPTREYVIGLRQESETREVLLHTGERADESEARAKKAEWDFSEFYACEVYRPLLRWAFEDVVAIHGRYGIAMNPLYALGAQRVGCCPCIMSRKAEIRMIAANFPDRIDRIRDEEEKLGSTFYPRKMTPEGFRSKAVQTAKKGVVNVPTIDDVVLWSKTERGGTQFDMRFSAPSCPSAGGLCE